jgi:hypothetical protein
MSNRKIIPITGRHTTVHSMLAEVMANEKIVSGFIICFDDEGTMSHGHVDTTRSDACMAAALLNEIAQSTMRDRDD